MYSRYNVLSETQNADVSELERAEYGAKAIESSHILDNSHNPYEGKHSRRRISVLPKNEVSKKFIQRA